MYGYHGGCCVRDIFQAIIRVRKFRTPYLYFFIDTAGPIPGEEYLTYDGVKINEQSIGEVFNKYYVLSKDPAMHDINWQEQRFIAHMRDNTHDTADLMQELLALRKQLLKSERMPDFFVDMHVRNSLENNISCAAYRAIFHDFLDDSGYTVGDAIFKPDKRAPSIPGVNIAEDNDNEEVDQRDCQMNMSYLAIPTITETEADDLRKLRSSNQAKEEDLLKLYKFEFDQLYVK